MDDFSHLDVAGQLLVVDDPRRTDQDLIPPLELDLSLDFLAVEERAVLAAIVPDEEPPVGGCDDGVVTRGEGVGKSQIIVFGAADQGPLPLKRMPEGIPFFRINE